MADIISTEVPRDIRNYKTKVLGPFSIKQAFCVSLAIIVDVAILIMIRDKISFDNFQPLVWVYFFIDIPIFAFMFDVQGVPMEKFLKQILQYNLFLPPKRKNTTALVERKKYDINKKEKRMRDKKIASMLHSHPDYKSYQ